VAGEYASDDVVLCLSKWNAQEWRRFLVPVATIRCNELMDVDRGLSLYLRLQLVLVDLPRWQSQPPSAIPPLRDSVSRQAVHAHRFPTGLFQGNQPRAFARRSKPLRRISPQRRPTI